MGDSDKIYNSPETSYTKKLIDAIPEGKTEDIKTFRTKGCNCKIILLKTNFVL